MNHYNTTPYPSHVLPETAGSFPQRSAGCEEHGSQSGSDDGMMYGAYAGVQGAEVDLDDDAHTLTSQSLNADGTPKRPMNAFMIFARRRRPQVSAENQSMRTGEISKILSKEWNSMPTTDKQFYLDQAKILKDNFNNKYPDYVYRRRPNNTRKKRKSDTAAHSADNAAASDQGDEVSPVGDCEPSPVESETYFGSNASQPRTTIDATGPFTGNSSFDTSYIFPPHDEAFTVPDPRQFHLNTQRHASHDPHTPSSPLSASRLSRPLNYHYLPAQNDSRSSPYASTHTGHPNAAWDGVPSGRSTSSGQWLGNSMERPPSSLDRPSKYQHQHQHNSYSPTSAQGSNWSGPSPSVSPVGLSHQNNLNQNINNHLFPTLSLPFYPGGQAQGNNNHNNSSYAGNASSGSSHSSSPSLYDSTTTTAGGSMSGGNSNPMLGTAASAAMSSSSSNGRPDSRYGNRSFSGSSASSISNSCIAPYASVSQQDGNRFHRAPAQSRGQSHPHLSSGFHHQLSSHHHTVTPTSATSPSNSEFWPRDQQFR